GGVQVQEVVRGPPQVLRQSETRRPGGAREPADGQPRPALGEAVERRLGLGRLDRRDGEVDLVAPLEQRRDDPLQRAELRVRLHREEDPHAAPATRATTSPVLKRTFCGMAVVKYTGSSPQARSDETRLRK